MYCRRVSIPPLGETRGSRIWANVKGMKKVLTHALVCVESAVSSKSEHSRHMSRCRAYIR